MRFALAAGATVFPSAAPDVARARRSIERTTTLAPYLVPGRTIVLDDPADELRFTIKTHCHLATDEWSRRHSAHTVDS